VYLCADWRYLKFAWVAARSIANELRRQFDVILIIERGHGSIGLKPPPDCTLIEVDTPIVPDGVPMPAHLSPFIFARTAAVDTLLANYRRLIYLDSDVRVTEPLSPLCTLDLRGAPIAAVEDCWSCLIQLPEANHASVPIAEPHEVSALAVKTGFSERQILAQLSKSQSDQRRDHCAKLGLRPDARYFNSGVLVIDTKTWSNMGVPHRISEFMQAHERHLFGQDQDILNGVFAGNWAELSPRWNFQTHYFGCGLDKIIFPAVYHYLDLIKPWRGCLWPYESEHIDAFTRLFSESPWPDLMKSSKIDVEDSANPIWSAVRSVKTQRAELSAIVLKKFAADFAARRFIDIDSTGQRLIADQIATVASC
jgi:lipopolysaccharide biosynthesis glycosyltransferase